MITRIKQWWCGFTNLHTYEVYNKIDPIDFRVKCWHCKHIKLTVDVPYKEIKKFFLKGQQQGDNMVIIEIKSLGLAGTNKPHKFLKLREGAYMMSFGDSQIYFPSKEIHFLSHK